MLNFRLYDKKLDIDLEEYRKSNEATKSGKNLLQMMEDVFIIRW